METSSLPFVYKTIPLFRRKYVSFIETSSSFLSFVISRNMKPVDYYIGFFNPRKLMQYKTMNILKY